MILYKKRVPIYGGELLIIVNDDFDESLKSQKIESDISYIDCLGLALDLIHNKNGSARWIILLKNKTSHGIIAHEALHTTNNILRNRGVEIDRSNDESAAYLLDYIVDEIYEFLNKSNINISLKKEIK